MEIVIWVIHERRGEDEQHGATSRFPSSETNKFKGRGRQQRQAIRSVLTLIRTPWTRWRRKEVSRPWPCILRTTIMILHGRLTHVCEFGCQLELVSAYLSRPATLFCVRLYGKPFNLGGLSSWGLLHQSYDLIRESELHCIGSVVIASLAFSREKPFMRVLVRISWNLSFCMMCSLYYSSQF